MPIPPLNLTWPVKITTFAFVKNKVTVASNTLSVPMPIPIGNAQFLLQDNFVLKLIFPYSLDVLTAAAMAKIDTNCDSDFLGIDGIGLTCTAATNR